ncbi:hypothetical protein ACFSR7_36060 [Cohnella sp. GCM10020058]|uniref:hypothetical protein n=1 Tax=Cohnella sp. GCM10020058 TaxID=3317330 RepID=UPI0036361650
MTLEELRILITAETSGLRKGLADVKRQMGEANKDISKATNAISRTVKGLGAAVAAIGLGSIFKDAVKDAISYEAAIGQINRLMGSSAAEFQKWVNTTAAGYGLARSEATRYGATYANLISGFSKGTAEVTKRTEDLIKTSAVVASATGRSVDDVMERIRSGLLGETDAIEDLGINVNVALLQTTNAFKQFANGKSWEKLSFQAQQSIIYYAILEQAARKYGNELAQNTATRQAAFIAQLKDARLALGQAFLPIYNYVLPALTQFASALASVMSFIAGFIQALFGVTAAQTDKQTNAVAAQTAAVGGLGKEYEKAGKKAKGAIASFDQLNLLNKNSGSDSPDSAGANNAAALSAGTLNNMATALADVSAAAQRLADKVKGLFTPVSNYFKDLKKDFDAFYADISPALKDIGDKLGKLKAPAFEIAILSMKELADTIKKDLDNAFVILTGDIKVLDDLLNLNLKKAAEDAWTALKKIDWKAMYNYIQNLNNPITLITNSLGAAITKWTVFDDAVKKLTGSFKKIGWSDILTGLQTVTNPFGTFINKVIDGITQTDLFKNSLSLLKTNVMDPLSKFFSSTFNVNISSVGTTMNDVKTKAQEAWPAIKNAVESAYTSIKGLKFEDIKTGILNVWEDLKIKTGTVWASMGTGIKNSINTVIDLINKFIAKVNSIKIDLPQVDLPFGGSIGGGSIGVPQIPSIPRLATGTNYIASEGLAYLHEGEAVVPKKYNPAAGGGDDERIVRLLTSIDQGIKSGMGVRVSLDRASLTQSVVGDMNDRSRRTGRPAYNA